MESEVEGRGLRCRGHSVGGGRAKGRARWCGEVLCGVGSCDVRTIASRVMKSLSRPPTGSEAPVLVWWGPILLRRRSAGPDAEDKPHLSLSLA